MGFIAKFALKSDVKNLKGNIRDKVQTLYDLELLSNKIFSKGLFSLYDPDLESIPYELHETKLNDIRGKYVRLHYWAYEIQEIVRLIEEYVVEIRIAVIYDTIFNGLDLTDREIKLDTNNVKKIVSNLHEIFDKKQSNKIISDIHNVISYNLEEIKDYQKRINILKKSKISKLTKFAIEELKEEYIDDILSDIDYEGNTYDEDIVRASEENSDEFMTWHEDVYEKPWDEILNEKIDELKNRLKEYETEIDRLNIDRIKKYATLFGYDIK